MQKVFFLFLIIIESAFAATKQSTAIWPGVAIEIPLSNATPWSFDLAGQGRFSDTRNTTDQYFIRPSISRSLPGLASLALGYDYITTSPVNIRLTEQRVWPQLTKRFNIIKNSTLSSRSRLELRWSHQPGGYAMRLRQRAELSTPLSSYSNSWFDIFDEVFINTKRPQWVSQERLDQNRIFIGFVKRLTKKINLDTGYLNIYRPRINDQIQHTIMIAIEFNSIHQQSSTIQAF